VDGADRRVSTPGFWEDLYQKGEDGWELGEPAPPLAAWLAGGGAFAAAGGETARVAVPGCGRGHDARLLNRHGYQVWGFDFAESAVAAARARAESDGVAIAFERQDVFALAAHYAAFFDGVWEYTCFCAIHPGRREEYARVMAAILRPQGTLLGCFYPLREGTGGPPFPVTAEGVRRVLEPHFDIQEAGPPAASVGRRRGLEWLVRATRKAGRTGTGG
jgi:methyl halide transferase